MHDDGSDQHFTGSYVGGTFDIFSPTSQSPYRRVPTAAPSPSTFRGHHTIAGHTNNGNAATTTIHDDDNDGLGFRYSGRVSTILLLLTFVLLLGMSLYFSFRSYYSPRIANDDHGGSGGQQQRDEKTTSDDQRPTIEQARQSLIKFFEEKKNQTVLEVVVVCSHADGAGDNPSDISGSDDGGGSPNADKGNSEVDFADIEEGMIEKDGCTKRRERVHTVSMAAATTTTTTSPPSALEKQMKMSDCCTICLEPYIIGDSVVWSLNDECHHVFHKECILDYFAYKMSKAHLCLCPTCRRRYCSVTVTDTDGEKRETNDQQQEP